MKRPNRFISAAMPLLVVLTVCSSLISVADVNERIEKAKQATEKGLYQQAVRQYQQAINDDPESLEAYVGLIGLRLTQHRDIDGLSLIDSAMASHPGTVQLWVYRATILQRQQKFAEAESAYDQVVRLAGNDIESLKTAAQFYQMVGASKKAAAVLVLINNSTPE